MHDIDPLADPLLSYTTPDLESYLQRADQPKAARLRKQWDEVFTKGGATCICGWYRGVGLLFRCLYCGEWFCAPCAEAHFGQTVQSWIISKRIASRLQAECEMRTEDGRRIHPPGDLVDADRSGKAQYP